MAATLTHALVKKMNMQGINGKIGFQHLQVKEVVIRKFVLRLQYRLTLTMYFHVWIYTADTDVHFRMFLFVCVLAAVRRNRLTCDATDQEIETKIKKMASKCTRSQWREN
ncbi:hypothetical protein GOODEAATRI_027463 [Goodea atripinnis]|uniref:Uncharacterized protein n=1 Tax=Goodea atripinnis TaxID=208336 RepID=A0ABV0N4R1_9TELE